MDESHDQLVNRAALSITMPPGADSEIVGHSKTHPKLPRELYSYIIDDIDDKPTLLSLLVSSKSVHSQAERTLYRSIKLSKPTSHELFIASILDPKRPHLACFVRFYSLSRGPADDDNFDILLTRALAMFVNLKYLSFQGILGFPSARVFPVGTSCPFQLHTFHWFGEASIRLLGPFLDSQQSLEVLWLYAENASFSVSPSSLRRLRTLAGSTKVITKIVPGRSNITCLEWGFPFQPIPSINTSLIPSLSHIRILSFGTHDVRPLLGTVVPLLECLEVFELHTIYAKELVDLHKLACLHTLVIGNTAWGFGPPVNPSDIFNQMKSLERVYVGHITCLEPSLPYRLWVRGAQKPVYASLYEADWWRETREM